MQAYNLLKINLQFLLTLLIVGFSSRILVAEQNLVFPLNAKTEIEYIVYPAANKNSDTLFLWLYSEAGPQKAEQAIALHIARNNIEVWRIDLFAAHFLPVASSSMDRIPDADIMELIEYAHKKTGKKIIPVTTGRGSLPVLKGVNRWQQKYKKSSALAGVILISPNFFIETPEPGLEGKLLDIVSKTNLSLFILQPKLSPWYWKLAQTIPALEKSGSDVFVQTIKGVRDRYYFRADANTLENETGKKLPSALIRASRYLKSLPDKKRHAVKREKENITVTTGKKERTLSAYKGNPTPKKLILKDIKGNEVNLKKLKGKVILVNFWASWCPPCVHEMPSMQRLQNRFFAKGFTILGVNMAEDVKTVRHFLKTKVSVHFPILFDKDGTALKDWGVFAFPTSYVIDKKGKIRYAIFGSVDWETEDIIKKITFLLNE